MFGRRYALRFIASLAVAVSVTAGRDAAAQSCDANHTIRWPESNPVWQLCWVAPPNSSGIDGSGLEIHSVYYNGKLVLGRGHIPIVNVKYDPGGCGGADLSYRDWNAEQAFFEANNVIRPGYAEPTVPPRTVCDNPGSDVGSFKGVAAQKLADRLILTTQVMAGWYRYIYTWTFFLDGTLQPGVRFTAVDNACTPLAHYHNVYFRLDMDVDGVGNDAVEEYNSGSWTPLTTESQRLHAPGQGRRWRVRDKVTGSGYELVSGPDADVANAWSVADFWALLYRSGEHDDGGATGGMDGDKAHIDRYVSGENIDGRDVVLWYRTGYRHDGPADCEIGGPTLHPIGTAGPNLPNVSIGDATVVEGNTGTTSASFDVTLSAASSSTVSVNYATANGTATAGSDYAAASGLVTFPAGVTRQTVTIAISGDTAVEPAETFTVNLTGPSNAGIGDGQGQGTIANDDAPPGGLAAYDAALKAPRCSSVGNACDSGPTLVNGRDGRGPEPNQPNSINSACADGVEGTYHYDESLDRLRVATLDGSSFAPGKTVRVEATVWAWSTPSLDKLELYYAANASSPSWQVIATLTPTAGGLQTLAATYVLPSGTLQAVRGRFRFQNTAGACGTGDFDDHDDLIFAVAGTATSQTAVFDPVLRVPKCGALAASCDSGLILLNGRDGRGPEQNQPNTINGSCPDGVEGVYHYDESSDRIRVFTNDGQPFAPGKTVTVQTTVWAWSTPSLDKLELYYAANANAPVWQSIATLTPPAGGAQTLSATYVLPAGTLQAVRARFRFQNTPGACGTGDFDDHDDLVFTVR